MNPFHRQFFFKNRKWSSLTNAHADDDHQVFRNLRTYMYIVHTWTIMLAILLKKSRREKKHWNIILLCSCFVCSHMAVPCQISKFWVWKIHTVFIISFRIYNFISLNHRIKTCILSVRCQTLCSQKKNRLFSLFSFSLVLCFRFYFFRTVCSYI